MQGTGSGVKKGERLNVSQKLKACKEQVVVLKRAKD